ncbi:MAG TPA: M13 family metallopeptidase, partial [Polyangia bacterium]
LFLFGAQPDAKDSTRTIASLNQGGLSLPDRDYYLKTDPKSVEIRQRYVAHVAASLMLAGEKAAPAGKHATAILAFETELARASLTRVEKREPHNLDHKLDRKALAALTPSFAWDRYLAAAGVPTVDAVNVSEPKFYQALDVHLHALPLDTLRAYLRWHVVRSASPYLSKPFVDENFAFYRKYLRGTPVNRPRWKRCVGLVDRNLGEALGKVYVDRMFSPTMKARTLEMTRAIEREMEAHLKALPWMSAATKQKALEKLHTVVNKVGYPERWRDYSTLAVERGGFFGDVVRAVAFESRRQLAKIGKPLDRGEWGMTPPTVNAYYDPQMNDINFPAGVLQPPLFDFKLDDAPNYGNTGATIGHELTHGFDDEGRKFDARGNLADWWTPADAEEFGRRAQCVVDEYAQFKIVDDIKINSRLTLGEDVADLGGTQLAYDAWKRANAGRTPPSGDGFSPDQRFFIGMAQWACDNERDEDKRLNATVNPHSPDEYRINGVVANMPTFAKAFACKAGQPMVRANVCRIW